MICDLIQRLRWFPQRFKWFMKPFEFVWVSMGSFVIILLYHTCVVFAPQGALGFVKWPYISCPLWDHAEALNWKWSLHWDTCPHHYKCIVMFNSKQQPVDWKHSWGLFIYLFFQAEIQLDVEKKMSNAWLITWYFSLFAQASCFCATLYWLVSACASDTIQAISKQHPCLEIQRFLKGIIYIFWCCVRMVMIYVESFDVFLVVFFFFSANNLADLACFGPYSLNISFVLFLRS